MEFKFLKKDQIEFREYQLNIVKTAISKNTLVVLPTGLGKTIIAILVALKRIERYPNSKILMLAPTRPLCAQHQKTFQTITEIPNEEIVLVTGKIRKDKRIEFYQKGKIIVATPQAVKNDLESNILKLTNFSLIIFDEAHRAVKDYPYVYIAKRYKQASLYPLILGLTASPGGKAEKIAEVKKNLFIEAVEIRTEFDKDVKPYIKEIKKEWIYVELPEEIKGIKQYLENALKEDIQWLKSVGIIQTSKLTKKSLLTLQQKVSKIIDEGNRGKYLFSVARKLAEALKIYHALELLETQGIESLYEFFENLANSKKRSDKLLIKDPRIWIVKERVRKLKEVGFEHPKLKKLISILKELISKNPKVRIIVFANYRATVQKIKESLDKNGIKSEILIGQAKKKGFGLSQKKQIEILNRFANSEFNVLIATSIGEEGLDIVDVQYAIFYEAVPSEIRMLQRRGRVGRKSPGKIIILLTKETMDEAFYWAAFHREKKMKKILYSMKKISDKKLKERKVKKTIFDWLK